MDRRFFALGFFFEFSDSFLDRGDFRFEVVKIFFQARGLFRVAVESALKTVSVSAATTTLALMTMFMMFTVSESVMSHFICLPSLLRLFFLIVYHI